MDKEQKRVSRYLCLQAIYAMDIDVDKKGSSKKQIGNIKIILDELVNDIKVENEKLIKDNSQAENIDFEIINLFENISKDQTSYAHKLFELLIINKDYVDTLIKARLNNWDMSRLALIDKLILRMSTAEMFFMDEVPPKVSIAEGVEIAKIFSTKDSSSFVNGILDAIYNEVYIKEISEK
mgnify:FL=1